MTYDPLELEADILRFWEKKKVFDKVRKKNADNKPFYFLDGPPYPSGYTHPGTAANKVTKDSIMRFKRMAGFDVRDRPGWDMHGLPIEHKAEKKLGLKTKKDVLDFGVSRFIEECKKFAFEHLGIMEKDFVRLGVWMPFKDAYLTLTPTYMESVWHGVKCAHDNGLIYKGKKVLHWCPRCATSLAKNELIYQTITEPSTYVKFKVKDKKDEYLIIWTTTPWTLPFNMAVMANPDLEYVKIQVGDEKWILAKGLVNAFMGAVAGKPYKILETFKGEKLEGLKYEHPFNEEMPYHQKAKKAYLVVMSTEFVSLSAGSGLVHMAPGCGPEDYLVGIKNNIPIFNELDEHGFFSGDSGDFVGWEAKKDDKKFVDLLKRKNLLIAEVPVEHEYAFCWRCMSPIVYRATEQWFMAISKIRDKILSEIKKVYIMPEYAKDVFLDWISNFQDWCITIQRFWNIPFPVWTCDKCGEYEVIGTIKELEKKSKKPVKDLHRPVVDKLTWECKCGGKMSRVPDVMSVWFDSGAASWASLDYPSNEKLFEKYFPADFILEGRDQIRAWFSALMNFSMAAYGKAPFRALYWHGFFNDEKGEVMSKSKGNFVPVMDMINKSGADPLRVALIEWCLPGDDIKFSWKQIEESYKALNVLWNMGELITKYSEFAKFNPAKVEPDFSELNKTDRWILSKFNTLKEKVTEAFEKYHLSEVPGLLKGFWLEDLSRGYIQIVRDRLAEKDKVALKILYDIYLDLLKLTAPIVPFTTEAIYQKFRDKFKLKDESLHLCSWPEAEKRFMDKQLEEQIDVVRKIVSSVLAIREKINRPVRWPVKKIFIETTDEKIKLSIKKHSDLIEALANVLEIAIEEKFAGIEYKVKADYAKLGPKYGKDTAEIIMRITEQSAESLKRKLDTDKKFTVKLGSGKKITIVPDDLIIEETLPKEMASISGEGHGVYLEVIETPEMLVSGFTREVIRKVQDLRKKAGLNKPDKISLVISAEVELNAKEIKDKVGAKELELGPVRARKWSDKFKVRGKEIAVGFDVLK